MNRKWIWIVLVLLLLGAVAGYRMFSRTNPDVVSAQPDVAISAANLIAAFERDNKGAEAQYANKIIQVRGTVVNIDSSGAVVLGAEGSPSVVVVGLEQAHIKDINRLKKGTTAVLQGVYSGYEKSPADANDLLAALGATIQLRSGGVK